MALVIRRPAGQRVGDSARRRRRSASQSALFPISATYRRAVLRPRLAGRGLPAGFWRFAIPFAAASVVGGLVLSRSEIFVMQWLADPAALGLFALAFGVAGHVFAPAQAFVGPLVPAISGLHEVDTDAAATPAFTRTLRAGSTIVALLMASALAALALLVPVLYGEEFSDASPLVLALGIASGLLVVGSPVTAFVSARLSAWELLRANLVALVLDVAVAVALIPLWGAWGAVAANVVGAGTRLLLLMRQGDQPPRPALADGGGGVRHRSGSAPLPASSPGSPPERFPGRLWRPRQRLQSWGWRSSFSSSVPAAVD